MAEIDDGDEDDDDSGGEYEGDLIGFTRDLPKRIPDITYLARYRFKQTGKFKKLRRVFLWFDIMFQGKKVAELYLSCAYPKDGSDNFSIGSKLMQAVEIANGGKLPPRGDRITTKVFKGKTFRVKTRTVKQDSKGNAREEVDWYSVIDHIVDIESVDGESEGKNEE